MGRRVGGSVGQGKTAAPAPNFPLPPSPFPFPVIHYQYTRPGKSVAVYDHLLVHDTPRLQVLYMPEYRGVEIQFGGELAMNDGGSMIWFLFPGKWYDIGSFFLAPGESGIRKHTGWYTNFCTPPRIEGDRWYVRDLFLDHWTSASGTGIWLDEDEFEEARASGLLTETEVSEVQRGRLELQHRIEDSWPPRAVTDFDVVKLAGDGIAK